MEVACLLLLAITILVAAKILLLVKKQLSLWKIFGKIAGPREAPIPLIGHVSLWNGVYGDFYGRITKLMKENIIAKGLEAGCVWIGPFPMLFLVGSNAAETILRSSEHTQKSYLYNFLRPWLQDGLVTSNGEKWKTRRRLLTPTFHFSILQDFLDVMNDHALVLAEKFEKYSDSCESFNLCRPIALCALDIICETAMGKSIHAQENEDSEYVSSVYRIAELTDRRTSSSWLWWDFIYNRTKAGREYNKILKILHSFSRAMINERMNDFYSKTKEVKKKRLAFLDLLLEVSEGGKVLTFKHIQEEVDTFMFAGHDTTAVAMAWALHLIGSHPEVQQKIQQELDNVLGHDIDKRITLEDMRKLNYLEMVIKESLRLFPSVPIIGRITTCDCVIDNHDIPKGTNCLLMTQLVNRNQHYWPDPDRFIPERFTLENSSGRHPFAYVPFSAGPRNCLGQRFALMEEKVVLAHLLRKYTFSSVDRMEDLRVVSDLLLRSDNGINVTIAARSCG